jgi:hypothetical protein
MCKLAWNTKYAAAMCSQEQKDAWKEKRTADEGKS